MAFPVYVYILRERHVLVDFNSNTSKGTSVHTKCLPIKQVINITVSI